MTYKIGIEIEFSCKDIFQFLKELDPNIFYIFTANSAKKNLPLIPYQIIIKPECTVENGWELNIPPGYPEILRVLEAFRKNDLVSFTEKCALHVHVDIDELLSPMEEVIENYKINEEKYIQEAIDKGMYLNLNTSITDTKDTRKKNLNIKAIERHHTLEHRIYKATFNYSEYRWCIKHTLKCLGIQNDG